MSTTNTNPRNVNLYQVLGLTPPSTGNTISTDNIKAAFRRALLLHHPDKSKSSPVLDSDARYSNISTQDGPPHSSLNAQKFTVDQIRFARQVLVNPTTRQQYDRDLLKNAQTSWNLDGVSGLTNFHPTELETVDLDDLDYDEKTATWTRMCRCGNDRAFEITEEDLEYESAIGSRELIVSCSGCSLHIRVVFEVLEEETG